MRYHLTPVRMSAIKKSTNNNKSPQKLIAGEGVEKREPLTLLVGMQTSRATMENSVEIPLKTGNRTAL